MNRDTLYFDGACPLCRAEIDKLRRFSRGRIRLQNIHELDGDDAALDKALLLSRLHLRTADGTWITGLAANVRAWRHTPFRWLWQVLEWPLVNRVSHWCYERWLQHRRRAARCDREAG